ncbi:MAG: DUF4832 domain-containing protein [Candidatus Gastranaerophilaceae bacterium]
MKKIFQTISKNLLFVLCTIIFLVCILFFFFHRFCPVSYTAADYTESPSVLQNPYCGFYEMNGFTLTDEPADNAAAWAKERFASNPGQLILLEVNLMNFSEQYLTQNAINQLEAILSEGQKDKIQFLIRFLYDWDGQAVTTEPSSIDQIMQHMQQTCGVINQYAGCILLLQGVYTGNCGEMTGTNYGTTDDITTLMNYQASLIDPSIYLAVRTPTHLRSILKTKTPLQADQAYDGSLNSRLGLYNDGMLGSVFDLGTYDDTPFSDPYDYEEKGTREEEIAYQNIICQFVPNGGEAVLDNEYNDLDNAIRDLSRMHVSYLNRSHDTAVLEKWKNSTYEEAGIWKGSSGYDYIAAHLGYRYFVSKTAVDFHPLLDDTAELDITIDNLGFAPAYRRFTTELILTNRESGDSVTVPVDFDNRRLSAGCSSVLSISIDVRNLEKGDYNLALSMTDETLELPVTFANKNSSSTVFLGTLTR